MDAVTIRRLIVFGVCALGVAGLYLVPSVSGSTGLVAMPRTAPEQAPRTSSTSAVRAPQAAATGAGQPADVRDAVDEPSQAPTERAETEVERTPPSSRPSAKGRTAYDPKDAADSEPPTTVTTISPAKVTPEKLTLSWPAATDDRRVIGYRIWLNGYEVATTAETSATVSWFNGDEGQHVVQIKAIDAAGNQSRAWSTLLVTRPAPEPTSTPRPSTTPTQAPGPKPEPKPTEPNPEPEPKPKPTESASVAPKPEPTTTQAAPAPTKPASSPTGAE